mmetsp:Transcript_29532/g.41552  ORF Transcript_29532/g.41552 Transcript_29532/m.41552 type:complete len:95 (+) Transcript_29532:51-335(+)
MEATRIPSTTVVTGLIVWQLVGTYEKSIIDSQTQNQELLTTKKEPLRVLKQRQRNVSMSYHKKLQLSPLLKMSPKQAPPRKAVKTRATFKQAWR